MISLTISILRYLKQNPDLYHCRIQKNLGLQEEDRGWTEYFAEFSIDKNTVIDITEDNLIVEKVQMIRIIEDRTKKKYYLHWNDMTTDLNKRVVQIISKEIFDKLASIFEECLEELNKNSIYQRFYNIHSKLWEENERERVAE